MWNKDKQQRLDFLRNKPSPDLSEDEQQELSILLAEVEQDEWDVLQPALSRLRSQQTEMQSEVKQIDAENALFGALVSRQEDLLERARLALESFSQEQKDLQKAYERIIGQP